MLLVRAQFVQRCSVCCSHTSAVLAAKYTPCPCRHPAMMRQLGGPDQERQSASTVSDAASSVLSVSQVHAGLLEGAVRRTDRVTAGVVWLVMVLGDCTQPCWETRAARRWQLACTAACCATCATRPWTGSLCECCSTGAWTGPRACARTCGTPPPRTRAGSRRAPACSSASSSDTARPRQEQLAPSCGALTVKHPRVPL